MACAKRDATCSTVSPCTGARKLPPKFRSARRRNFRRGRKPSARAESGSRKVSGAMTWEALTDLCAAAAAARWRRHAKTWCLERETAARRFCLWERARVRRRMNRAFRLWGRPASCWILRWRRAGLLRSFIILQMSLNAGPPQNRNPLREETEACLPYLREQFRLIQPKIVVCLGSVASTALIGPEAKITAVRGTWHEKKGTYFTATYHPAALLRDESKKIFMWRDLKAVQERLHEII